MILPRFGRVRMAERSKALRSGRSLVLQAWVRIPLLTIAFSSLLLYIVFTEEIFLLMYLFPPSEK